MFSENCRAVGQMRCRELGPVKSAHFLQRDSIFRAAHIKRRAHAKINPMEKMAQ